ncbi:MAG TPA: DUF4386 family protein [Steroidobacteraceae bacterium]|jgi:hypothetical protein
MSIAQSAGRTAGALIIVQMVGGYLTNFGLLGPATAPPGFLVNAAPHALRVGAAALVGIVAGAMATAIAITVLPVFKKHSERMAMLLVALSIAALSLAVVENGKVMSLLSLSQAYAASGATDPAAFEGLRGVVAASRNWAHFTHLIVGGSTFFVLYATAFRFALVPRALAAFGMAAAALQMATVSMPLLGGHVIFVLLAPAGLANLALAIWLLTKGLADKDAVTM